MKYVTNEINRYFSVQKQVMQYKQQTEKQLHELFKIHKKLIFYRTMKYPIPQNYKYFLFEKKISVPKNIKPKFSRSKKNPYMDDFLKHIHKYKKLYTNIPFIKDIYLCNSITFNALHKNSDIDLFIVTKKNSLRRARFFSLLFFTLTGLKRSMKNKSKKFCLSFYVTEDAQNLYNISLPHSDIYLSYWITHLVSLYHETPKQEKNIYKQNIRTTILLKNTLSKQSIYLGNTIFYGNSKTKKILERIFRSRRGNIFEFILKTIRSPIVIIKSKQHKEGGWGIIINNKILKFHLDIRKKVHLLYELQKKNFS